MNRDCNPPPPLFFFLLNIKTKPTLSIWSSFCFRCASSQMAEGPTPVTWKALAVSVSLFTALSLSSGGGTFPTPLPLHQLSHLLDWRWEMFHESLQGSCASAGTLCAVQTGWRHQAHLRNEHCEQRAARRQQEWPEWRWQYMARTILVAHTHGILSHLCSLEQIWSVWISVDFVSLWLHSHYNCKPPQIVNH